MELSSPVLNIPERHDDAPSGAAFASSVIKLAGENRDEAIIAEVLAGNVPQFMRSLCPVVRKSISVNGQERKIVFYVTPDYLCIGHDDDYLRVPLNPLSATRVANALSTVLPTRAMVNTIFEQADIRLLAQPLPYGPNMRMTSWVIDSNSRIQKQLAGITPGNLVAGHKKDVVLARGLWFDKEGEPWPADHAPTVAIYGWAKTIRDGQWTIWQDLNTSSHDNKYEDYSHGIRLVSGTAIYNDEHVGIDEILADPINCTLLSDEGALPASQYPST